MQSIGIKKRFDALVTQRKTLDQTLEVIEQFVVPHRGEFFRPMQDEHEVRWRRREIFDSTAVDSCETLAASVQAALTSSSVMWLFIGFRNEVLINNQKAMAWAEAVTKRIYESLQDSNFDLESSEFYLDLCSFGTAVIFEEAESEDPKKWEGIDFQAAPIRDCYFEVSHKNQIMRFYRRYQWNPLQIQDKFGDDTPQCVLDVIDNQDSNNIRFQVVFCVFSRYNKRHNIDTNSMLAASERPFGWKWVLHKDGSQIGHEGGYYEQPAYIARWRKTTGSQMGYSPAHICLSDILTLNELTEETLESLGKAIDPSILTEERNLITDMDLGRGGLTVVTDIDKTKAFESGARFDVGELRIDRLQESIQRAFRIDKLQMKDSPAMTATEVQVRYELMQRLLGPTVGRLKSDFLDPLVNRTFKILFRAGQLPEIPQIVIDEGGELDIQYIGPLPRAQRQEVVQATNQWLANTAGIYEIAPEIMDLPDFDMIARDTAQLSGLPAKYMKTDNAVKRIRKGREEAQAQAQQSELMQQEGDAMKAQGDGEQAMDQAMTNKEQLQLVR